MYSNKNKIYSSKIDIENMSHETDDNNIMDFNEKMNFINNCLYKMQNINRKENNGYEYLIEQCTNQENKIEDLKNDINNLNDKINEITISKNDIDKKILLKKVFVSSNKISNNEKIDIIEEEIEKINSEIKQLSEEIKVFADFSLDINCEIEEIKKNIDNITKENNQLKRDISKYEKEEKLVILENIRINEKIKSQEYTSQQFLKEIENKTNLFMMNHQKKF
jgi:chromosome segregation ATPase